jgi:hypothetical protein
LLVRIETNDLVNPTSAYNTSNAKADPCAIKLKAQLSLKEVLQDITSIDSYFKLTAQTVEENRLQQQLREGGAEGGDVGDGEGGYLTLNQLAEKKIEGIERLAASTADGRRGDQTFSPQQQQQQHQQQYPRSSFSASIPIPAVLPRNPSNTGFGASSLPDDTVSVSSSNSNNGGLSRSPPRGGNGESNPLNALNSNLNNLFNGISHTTQSMISTSLSSLQSVAAQAAASTDNSSNRSNNNSTKNSNQSPARLPPPSSSSSSSSSSKR